MVSATPTRLVVAGALIIERSGQLIAVNSPSVPGLLQGQANVTQMTLNARLNYNCAFGPHRLVGFVAYEQSTYNSDVFSAYYSGFASTQIPEFFAGSESDCVTGQPFASARQNYFGWV